MKPVLFEEHLDTDWDCRRSSQRSWWLFANLCGLDAPIVAVVWLLAFSRAFESPVEWPVYAVLFLTVWSIYIADRLIDVHHQKNWQLATARHKFAHQYQTALIALLMITLSLAALLTFSSLSLALITSGVMLGLVVLLYFTVFVRLFPRLKPMQAKEFACGVVFAIGTALGVDAWRQGAFVSPLAYLPPVLLFAVLCTYNCLIISAREHDSDHMNDPSAAACWWKQIDRDLSFYGLGLIFVSGCLCLLGTYSTIYLAIFSSSFLLLTLHLFKTRLSQSLSRVLADAVLLSPLLLVI